MPAVKSNTRGQQVLRYPLKMFAAGTDYLQIDMMDYVAVGQEEKRTRRKPSTPFDPNDLSTYFSADLLVDDVKERRYLRKIEERFRKNTNKAPRGTVLLPIPSGIQDSNSVNYTDDSMNSLVSAGLGAVEGSMIDAGQSLAAGNFGDIPKDIQKQLEDGIKNSGLTIESAQDLITKQLAGQALGIFGGNVSIQQLLARSGGQIFNPNMELLFNSPSIRNFNFTFKIVPRSQDEGEQVRQIIRFFKKGMAPKSDGNGLYLKTPNVFELTYRKGAEQGHPFLHRFKQCFLTNVSVNYTGEGVYATYDDGTPVSMNLNLSFKELAPIYDVDYDDPDIGGVGY